MISVCTRGYNAHYHDLIQANEEISRVYASTKNLRQQETCDRRQTAKGKLYEKYNIYLFAHYFLVYVCHEKLYYIVLYSHITWQKHSHITRTYFCTSKVSEPKLRYGIWMMEL